MATNVCTVTAEYQIKETADIKCPKITIKVDTEFGADEIHEQAKYDYFKKKAQKHLTDSLTERVKQFDGPIKDAQKKVDKMRTTVESLTRIFQSGQGWEKVESLQSRALKEQVALEKFITVANESIKQAVRSIEKIEGERWMQALEREAHAFAVKKYKSAERWKLVKLVAKVALVGLVVLTIAAIGIAASVLTMNPGPLALAAVIIGSVISGSTAIYKVSKLVSDNWMDEDRVMKKIEEDLVALGKVTADVKKNRTPKLEQHLVELDNFRYKRANNLRAIDKEIAAMENVVTKLNTQLAAVARDVPESKDIKAKKKTAEEFKVVIAKLKTERKKVDDEDKAAKKIIEEAKVHLKNFQEIGKMDIPSKPIRDKGDKLKSTLSTLGELLKNSQQLSNALNPK